MDAKQKLAEAKQAIIDLNNKKITEKQAEEFFTKATKLLEAECTEDTPCEAEGCQLCCPHSDRDFYCCLDCGIETDWGAEIDHAIDKLEDR